MRVLHTSDWHLGRTLRGYSRAPEHEAFLDELVEVARDVDLVLISGDVFETCNPPIESEELFFDTLARLGDGGRRAVVVIAGNHDSPDRIRAPGPLTSGHAVWILGRPGDVPRPQVRPPDAGGVVLAGVGPSVLTLDLPCGQRAVVAALPYPSEARLRQLLSPSLDEGDLQAAYSARIGRAFATLAESYEPNAVNLAMSHLAVRSCMPSGSERALVGGAYQIDAHALPAKAQYTALGHLHLAQQVPDAPALARYAGAPLAMRFSEADYSRAHVVVTVDPGGEASVELLPVQAGRPLVAWQATGLGEVHQRVESGQDQSAFIDLELTVDRHLTHGELARLKALPRDFVRVRAILPEAVVTPLVDPGLRRDLPVGDLFRAFYREQTGAEPEDGLVDMFLELANPLDVGASTRQAG